MKELFKSDEQRAIAALKIAEHIVEALDQYVQCPWEKTWNTVEVSDSKGNVWAVEYELRPPGLMKHNWQPYLGDD